MLTIKILGTGCEKCEKLEDITRQAVDSFRMPAEVIKVTDRNEIGKYPILVTPGLVVNDKLVCSGRIPSQGEVITWMANATLESE